MRGKYKRKNELRHVRNSYGMYKLHSKRRTQYQKVNTGQDIDSFHKALKEVMTFRECEIVFMLPEGTCARDLRNGKFKSSRIRKSGGTYLITVKECIRLYEDYWTQRALFDESYLYSGYDGKRMTETEFLLRYGSLYERLDKPKEIDEGDTTGIELV